MDSRFSSSGNKENDPEGMEHVNALLASLTIGSQATHGQNTPFSVFVDEGDDELEVTSTSWTDAQEQELLDAYCKKQLDEKSRVAEYKVPTALITKLHEFQVAGFRMLLHQEVEGAQNPFFSQRKDGKWWCPMTYQYLKGQEEPTRIHGGILADDMGLGKTIQILAVILAHPPKGNVTYPITDTSKGPRCTLIVCPANVMKVWEQEIHKHVKPNTLSVEKYHGAKRASLLCNQVVLGKRIDVLITSYETLGREFNEFKKREESRKNPSENGSDNHERLIFDVDLHRVVLDEAHEIRNNNARSQACFHLKADHRLCLTGTPIVNNPSDIQPLFSFLGLYPVSDRKIFDTKVTAPIMDKRKVGLKRLRAMLSTFTMRRTKKETSSELNLLPKNVLDKTVPFSLGIHQEVERDLFVVGKKLFNSLYDPVSKSLPTTKMFTMVVRLRQACNHAGLVPKRVRKLVSAALNLFGERDRIHSDEAMKVLSELVGKENNEDGKLLDPDRDDAKITEDDTNWMPPSPKQDALVKAIAKMPQGEKGVVFSNFTSYLDLIQHTMEMNGIPFLRFDGTIPQEKRYESLAKFSEEGDTTRVLLCSFKVGSVGLDFSRANHCFLLEPSWNNSSEQQAMDRLHRNGQIRQVRVVRFNMKNSIETRLMEMSASKSALAKAAMHKITQKEEKMARMTFLRDLFLGSTDEKGWDAAVNTEE